MRAVARHLREENNNDSIETDKNTLPHIDRLEKKETVTKKI